MNKNSASGLAEKNLYTKPSKVSKLLPVDSVLSSNDPFNETNPAQKSNKERTLQKRATAFGFQNASFQLAMQRKKQDSNRYHKGQEVPFVVDLSHFKLYGPGVYLFFQFLWKFSLLFLVLSLVSLCPLIYNYIEGGRFSNSVSSLSVYVSRTSISSIYGNNPNLTSDEQITYSKNAKLVNCISDLTICLLITVFYFYWTSQSSKRTEEIKKSVKLANYFTIELTQFPQTASIPEIYNFFNKFGMVTEVAPVINYAETIQLSKQIYNYEIQMKTLKIQENDDSQVSHSERIKKIEQKMAKLYEELAKQESKTKQEVIKYYVTFSTPLQRANTLKRFKKVYSSFCGFCAKIPADYLLNQQKVHIQACHDQPGQILWENVHITWKSRWIRALVQLFLLLIIVAAGFFLIALLNILTPPSSSDSIDTSLYTTTTILQQTNGTIVQSWCLKNTDSATSTPQLSNLCYSYILRYYYGIAITYSITVVVIIIKALLKQLVIAIAKFQRYKQQTQQSIDIVKNLVILYIMTTVVIGFFLQANLFGIDFKFLIPNLIKDWSLISNASMLTSYSSLQWGWYNDIGYQIWFTWLILAVSPHIYMPLVNYLMECIQERRAKSQKIQKNMEKALEGSQFQVQDNYANIIMIFLIGLTFSGGMPSMIILSFIGIITRYAYFKFTFIRFCKVPKTIDQALNDTVLSYIPWALLIHFGMTIWMYSEPKIFAFEQSIFSEWYKVSTSSFLSFFAQIISMAIASYYYSLVAGIILFTILIKEVIYNFFAMVFKREDDLLEQIQKQDTSTDLVGMMRSQRGITTSYKIQNNPNYFEILSIKQKMKSRLQNGDFNLKQKCETKQNN